MHISTEYLANGDRYGKYYHSQQIESCIQPFHFHIYIWPLPILKVNVKVMHISTGNILQTVKDSPNITIAIKYEVAYELLISIFSFDLGPI